MHRTTLLAGFASALALFAGACDSGAECYSHPPVSSSSVTINGETWTDETSTASNNESIFIAVSGPDSLSSLTMTVQRLPVGTYDLLAVGTEFQLFYGGLFHSQLQSGELTITASTPGTGELCDGKFNFDFRFSATDDAGNQQSGAGQSDSANIPGPGDTGGGGGGGGGGGVASCTDSTGVCSQLNSGSISAFQSECAGAGNAFAMSSCASGAYSCTGGTGTSGGTSVALDIQWPGGICSNPAYQDMIYLKGTCENSLGGAYSGDPDSCCSGSSAPGPGGAFCL